MVWLLLTSLLVQLKWQDILLVTDNSTDSAVPTAVHNLSTMSVQHVHYGQWDSEEVSEHWLQDVVQTGDDSWRPLHFLIVCSLPCVTSVLVKATQLEHKLGTQSAFGMTSRWLLMTTGSDALLDNQYLNNVTMDNVALVHAHHKTKEQDPLYYPSNGVKMYTLMWRGQNRVWSGVNTKSLSAVWSASFRDCRRHHNQQTGVEAERLLFPNLEYGYNGRRLRLLAKQWLNHVTAHWDNGHKTWSGFVMDVIRLASQQLNFTYEIEDFDNETWGAGTAADADDSYYGFVMKQKADVGLAPITFVLERAEVMDFPTALVFSHIMMIYRKPEVSRGFWMLFNPLTTPLLLAIGWSLVLMSLFLFTLEMASNCSADGQRQVKVCDVTPRHLMNTFDKVIQLTGAALLQEPSERRLRSGPARVLLWSWWMLSLVLAAAYSGTLTAFLSVSKQPQLFSSAVDLVTKTHDYRWGWLKDSSIDLSVKSSNSSVYHKLWSGVQRFGQTDPEVVSENITKLIDKVRNEDFVLIRQDYQGISSVMGGDCGLAVVDAGIGQAMSSLALPRGSALTKPLSHLILRLYSSGLLSQLKDKWFPRTLCSPTPPGPVVISMVHVQGLLLVLPLVLGLALLVLAAEIVYRKKSRKAKKGNEQ